MTTFRRGVTLFVATLLGARACADEASVATSQVPLYPDLGDYHYAIGTSEPLAQQ